MSAPCEVRDVACYVLQKADPDAGDLISAAQVHLLLYYAQGFHLAIHGTPLFPDDVVAGSHGPWVPTLADLGPPGEAPCIPAIFDAAAVLTTDAMELLDEVYVVYGQFTTWKLRGLAQGDPPWRNTATDHVIAPDALRAYFQAQLIDPQ